MVSTLLLLAAAVHFLPSEVAMAEDGKRLLFTLTPQDPAASLDVAAAPAHAAVARIWLWEPGGRKIGQRLGTLIGTRDAVDRAVARPLTRSALHSDRAAFTPDGEQVSFRSARDGSGHRRVWILPMDGGEAEPWTDPARDVRTYAWLPDGSLAYTAGDEGQELWLVPTDDGPEQRLHQASGLQGIVPNFDGTEIAFTTDDGNAGTLWSVSIADGTVRRIAEEAGLHSPAWFRDGEAIAWLVSGNGAPDEIRSRGEPGSDAFTVFTASAEAPTLRGLRTGAEDARLFVVAEGAGVARMLRVLPGNGRAEAVTPPDGRCGDFALRANGEKVAFVWWAAEQPPEVATWTFPDKYVEVRTQRNPVFLESAPREGENE